MSDVFVFTLGSKSFEFFEIFVNFFYVFVDVYKNWFQTRLVNTEFLCVKAAIKMKRKENYTFQNVPKHFWNCGMRKLSSKICALQKYSLKLLGHSNNFCIFYVIFSAITRPFHVAFAVFFDIFSEILMPFHVTFHFFWHIFWNYIAFSRNFCVFLKYSLKLYFSAFTCNFARNGESKSLKVVNVTMA